MANEYAVNQADLTAVADAIREKGGTTDALVFPDGFVDAVGAIEAGSSGDSDDLLVAVAEDMLTELNSNAITAVNTQAFRTVHSMKRVVLPNCLKFVQDAFNGNKGIEEIELVNYTGNADYGSQLFFSGNTALKRAYMPSCTTIGTQMFTACTALTDIVVSDEIYRLGGNCLNGTAIAEFVHPTVTEMYNRVFMNCPNLKKVDINNSGWYVEGNLCQNASVLETFIMRSTNFCRLGATTAFAGTPIESGTGYIYVPSALVEEYKAATNWATYADQIRAIEDYPEITGG